MPVGYNVLANNVAPLPDEINKEGNAVVFNPQPLLEIAKMDEAQKERKAREEEMRQAARENQLAITLGKIHDHTREEDNLELGNHIKDFSGLVNDLQPDLNSKDVGKRTAAQLQVNTKLNELNSHIDTSNQRRIAIAKIDNTVATSPKGSYWDNGWAEAKQQSLVGKPFDILANAPVPTYDIGDDVDKHVLKQLANTGKINPTYKLDPYGQTVIDSYQTPDPNIVKAEKIKRFDTNELAQREVHFQMAALQKNDPDVVKEKYTLPNGALDYKQYYLDHTPDAKTIEKEKVINPPSVPSSGGPTYSQTIPIVAQGGKESPILSYPLATDKSAVRADIGGKTYDVTSLEDVRVDSDGKPVSGYGIIAKPTSKYIDAQHAFDKKHTSIQTTHDKLITLADEGKDEKGNPLNIPVDQQKSIINQTTKSQFNELEKHVPKADDYPTDTEKKLMTGAEIEKASKGVDIKELVKNGKTKGARLVDYTTEKKPISTVNNFDEYVNLYKSTKGIPDASTLKKLKEKWDSKIK